MHSELGEKMKKLTLRLVVFFLVLIFQNVISSSNVYSQNVIRVQSDAQKFYQIVSINTDKFILTLRDPNGNVLKTKVVPQTKITKGGTTLQLSELESGEEVTIILTSMNNEIIPTVMAIVVVE